MPQNVPDFFHAQANLAANPYPFLWLVEGRNPDDEPLVDVDGNKRILRITSNTEDVSFGQQSSGSPITWISYPFRFTEMEADLEGNRSSMTLVVSAGAGELSKWWEANDFFRDCVVYLHLVHALMLDDPNAKVTFRMRCSDSTYSMEQLSLNLAAGNFTSFDVPQQIVTPTCRWTYRKEGCYFIGDPGDSDLGDCSQTLAACRLRGEWEADNSLPVIHPRQFGGEPNPPRGAV